MVVEVKNITDHEICVRTGTDSTNYCFYFVPPNGSVKVNEKQASLIAGVIKQLKIEGLSVSRGVKPKIAKTRKSAVTWVEKPSISKKASED